MFAKLIESGTSDQKQIPIAKDEFLIGRGSDCDLRLGSSEVSRHHCQMRFRGKEVTLIDLGSSNGTYINGVRVRSQAPLHSGDEVRVASFVFLLELDDQEGITWHKDAGVDPNAHTMRLKGARRDPGTGSAGKEKDHPPGEAGGAEGKASG